MREDEGLFGKMMMVLTLKDGVVESEFGQRRPPAPPPRGKAFLQPQP